MDDVDIVFDDNPSILQQKFFPFLVAFLSFVQFHELDFPDINVFNFILSLDVQFVPIFFPISI